MSSSGARWIADERLGRHDLGERQPASLRVLPEDGGDPTIAAPPACYPWIERLDADSFREWLLICVDAGLVGDRSAH